MGLYNYYQRKGEYPIVTLTQREALNILINWYGRFVYFDICEYFIYIYISLSLCDLFAE